VFEGEALLAAVYNALRANEALWQTTLLIVLYDEHGGFYDHVEPPVAIAPDYHQEEFTFDRLGVRVPVVLISPWVGSGVCSTNFDHTSLLRFVQDKWNLGPLGARADQAATFHSVILPESRDTPPMIVAPLGGAPPSAVAGQDLTEHQSAIVALSHALESMGGEDPAVIAGRSQHILSGAQSQMDAAVDRVEAFLRNKRAQAG
jgi:phospholipase C